MSKRVTATPRVRYQCSACGERFVPRHTAHGSLRSPLRHSPAPPGGPRRPGVAPCPRCQAIEGHEHFAVEGPGGGVDEH